MDSADDLSVDPLIGSILAGKYRIQSRVGGGAMGVVYEARQIALDKRVAIKVLNRELQTRLQFVSRFHVEAKAASLLDHANSTRVLDFGTDDSGLLYICMEFLEGKNLFELVATEWPLEQGRVASLTIQILAALARAHDLGILHRDIKPENIVLQLRTDDEGDAQDLVKVCDFGIAKLEGYEMVGRGRDSGTMNAVSVNAVPSVSVPGPALTGVGLIMGTPDYMSPEQARGETLDARSDIYSVGVVLYYLLAGRAPFDGETPVEILTKHITEEPPPPSSLANIDAELDAICRKAMSKDPDDRFASAREMRTALRKTSVFLRLHELTGPQSSESTSPGVGGPRMPGSNGPLAPTSAPLSTEPTLPEGRLMPIETTERARPARSKVGTFVLLFAGLLTLASVAMALRARATVASTNVDAGAPAAATTGLSASSIAAVDEDSGANVSAITHATAEPIATAVLVDPRPAPTGKASSVAALAASSASPSSAASGGSTPLVATPPSATVAAMTPPPVPTPDPVPTPVPVPTPAPPPTVAAPPPFHPENAHVDVGKIETDRVTARAINDVLRHTNFQRCYSAALVAVGASRAGTGLLALSIDQNRVESAHLSGMALPGLAACIEGQVARARIADADTGDATANITLQFVSP